MTGVSDERKSSESNSQGTCLWVGVVNPFLLEPERLAAAGEEPYPRHLIGVRNDTGWLAEPVIDGDGRAWICATPDEWEAFVAAVKRGEFDLMPHTRLLPAMEIAAPILEPAEPEPGIIPGEVTLDAALDEPTVVGVRRGVVPDPPYADSTE